MRSLPNIDENELSQVVLRGYGIKVLKITPIRRVYYLETNLGPRFFKPFYLSEERLKLIAKAKEHLSKQGFTSFAHFLSTIDGKPYFREKNQLYYMTDWLEGHHCNYDNPFELKQAARLFAEFHLAAKGFQPPEEMASYLGCWPEIFQLHTSELLDCRKQAKTFKKPSLFEKNFLNKIDFYLQEAEKAIILLEKSDYTDIVKQAQSELPFCHHDPAHHNIIMLPENKPILIDFDYLLQDLHLHDLASIILRNGKVSEWNPKRCNFLLKAYQEIKPVTPEEYQVVKAFMTFPHEIWFLARIRYLEEKPWPLHYFLKEWERKTRFEEAKQVFLKGFPFIGD